MDLNVDRSLQNNAFGNWRLGREFVLERASIPLPGGICVADANASVDYVRTRSAVLHNHVAQSQGHCFLFIQPPGVKGVVGLHHVLHAPGASPPVLLHKLAGAGCACIRHAHAPREACLHHGFMDSWVMIQMLTCTFSMHHMHGIMRCSMLSGMLLRRPDSPPAS